jgi:hypothetical protein
MVFLLAGCVVPVAEQFFYEVLGITPEDADIRTSIEIIIQVPPGTLWLEDATFFGLDLGRDMGIPVSPFPSLLGKDGPEEHPKIPIIHLKTEEQQGCIRQGMAHVNRNQVFIAGHADEEVKIIILSQDRWSRSANRPNRW